MHKLSVSLIDDIEKSSYTIAQQAVDFFNDWKAGKVYIPMQALRAMGRRYLYLRDAQDLRPLEVYEFGRLFAFFSLVYPPDGDIPSVAGLAIDFCNLINTRENIPSPTE